MAPREQLEIDAVHQKVVDTLHRIVSVVGVATVAVGLVRARLIGQLWPFVVPCVALGLVLLSFAFRDRVSWFARSCLILIGFTVAGTVVMYTFGVAAPSGILVPTGIVIAWLIWNRWQATLFTVCGVLALLVVALKNIHWGNGLESRMPAFNRAPLFWANLGVLYLAVGATILGVVRVLFASFREAVARAQEGERQSKADREKLAGILGGIHDAIFLHDPESGEILEMHGRIEEVYGFDRGEILKKGIGIVSAGVPPWTPAEGRHWIERCRREGPQNFPWYARRADGSTFWVQVDMRIVVLQESERILVTVRDVDKSVRTQRELTALNADLEHRVKARTSEIENARAASESFSYTVSHDLRAPLRAIDGFAKALGEDFGGALPPEGIDYLERIASRASRMGRLIDALLGLSRLDRHAIVPRVVDVAAIVQEVREEVSVSEAAEGHGPDRVEWVVEELPPLESDPELVKQVFANLIANAAKFSRRVERARISVRAVPRGDGVWYEVADNGDGFDMAYANQLFQAFHRLHGDSIEGLGIGLATVKKIVDRLGGAIEAEGRPGKGATFRFRPTPPMTESVAAEGASDSDG